MHVRALLFSFVMVAFTTAAYISKKQLTIAEWNGDLDVNPEELGEYVEGDIVVAKGKNGIIGELGRWHNGVIPYEISGYFYSNEKKTILKAFDEFHNLTCLRFQPRTKDDIDFISIQNNPTGCWSYVGRVGGKQEVNLQSPACVTKIGTVIHELLHATGFHHEQNRWERDSYVTVQWDSIQKGKEANFKKLSKAEVDGYGVSYDYDSVMHYSTKAFSSNGNPTLVATFPGTTIGQRNGFSDGDVAKVRKMYCDK